MLIQLPRGGLSILRLVSGRDDILVEECSPDWTTAANEEELGWDGEESWSSLAGLVYSDEMEALDCGVGGAGEVGRGCSPDCTTAANPPEDAGGAAGTAGRLCWLIRPKMFRQKSTLCCTAARLSPLKLVNCNPTPLGVGETTVASSVTRFMSGGRCK